MYWLYRTRSYVRYNQEVAALLATPPTHKPSRNECGYGFPSPLQDEPYSVALDLTFQVNPKHTHPDNYQNGSAFTLFSERLIDLMRKYEVKFESFPAKLVDANGNPQDHLRYCIFHSLEGTLDAMDKRQSEWQGSSQIGIPRLVLDYSKFEHRPIFLCNLVYRTLMRDDLKQEIQQTGITGFEFLEPGKFRSGRYGFPPPYED